MGSIIIKPTLCTDLPNPLVPARPATPPPLPPPQVSRFIGPPGTQSAMETGDVLLSINNVPVQTWPALLEVCRQLQRRQTDSVCVFRAQAVVMLPLTVGAQHPAD